MGGVAVLVLALICFIFYPVKGDRVELVTGFNRLLFSLLSAVICFSLFCTTIELPKAFHELLTILGETSYSVYLLHPVVWTVFERLTLKFAIKLPSVLTVVLPICSTLIMSYFVYNIIEKYFIRIGREILNGRKQESYILNKQV